jgi:hypothetical protein
VKRFQANLILVCAVLSLGASSPSPFTPRDVISRLAGVWNGLQAYTCTWNVHEVKGTQVQDRVYRVFFQKPLLTRAEVVDGDGKGSVAVWDGGDKVRGHQGGILSIINLNLDIHNHLAVSLRGATIAQINLGWLLSHLQSIGAANFTVTQRGENSVLSAEVKDPPPDTDVVREEYIFAPNGLPVEAFQYADNGVVLKHVAYSDYRLNVSLPPSTWRT